MHNEKPSLVGGGGGGGSMDILRNTLIPGESM